MGHLLFVKDFFPSLPKRNNDTPGAGPPAASNYKQGAEDNVISICLSCSPSTAEAYNNDFPHDMQLSLVQLQEAYRCQGRDKLAQELDEPATEEERRNWDGGPQKELKNFPSDFKILISIT